MDKRIRYVIVLDTETAPCDKARKNVSPWNMFVYDCGWQICDKRGNIYRSRSFVNADIFLGEKALMGSAYYAKKIPQYWEEIKSGQRILTSFNKILKTLKEDIKEFEVSEIYAHNARFDYGSLTNTERWLTKSKYRYFFPYNVTICDTLKMCRQTFGKQKMYKEWCVKNGYLTKNNQPRFTAEIIYRYISGDNDFVEKHTGLEDVDIERQIMVACFRKHMKLERRLWAD